MILINRFIVNPFMENTYIINDEETKESAVIDPGCIDSYESMQLEKFISENKLIVKYLINTHCHIDHILGCKFIKEKYNPVFLVPEKDMPLLNNAERQALTFGINMDPPPKPDNFITENLKINFGETEIKFLFTPGHTPGEYCLLLEKEKICISGDVLFNGSIGRTDLWGGDYNALINSITTKLLTLPDDFTVYPGHGESTTIGKEKRENPFLNPV